MSQQLVCTGFVPQKWNQNKCNACFKWRTAHADLPVGGGEAPSTAAAHPEEGRPRSQSLAEMVAAAKAKRGVSMGRDGALHVERSPQQESRRVDPDDKLNNKLNQQPTNTKIAEESVHHSELPATPTEAETGGRTEDAQTDQDQPAGVAEAVETEQPARERNMSADMGDRQTAEPAAELEDMAETSGLADGLAYLKADYEREKNSTPVKTEEEVFDSEGPLTRSRRSSVNSISSFEAEPDGAAAEDAEAARETE